MKKPLLCGIAALAMPISAAASCGAAFCSINTSWDVQGAWQEPGARLDLRYEYLNQDQPMSGRERVAFGRLTRHHDEVHTRNRNLLASLDVTLNADWSVNALVPLAHRGHAHVHNHRGAQLPETWNFTEMGDARLLARRRLGGFEEGAHSLGAWGLNLGAKLPTGETDVRNSSGALAERSLQPGSGTTDLLAGAYYTQADHERGMSWFMQGLVQLPANEHDGYRPGRRLSLDAGVRYAADDRLSLLLQANALYRARDRGAQAEPEDTGGRALYLSPGLSYALSDRLQVYGFLQLPLYQYVNGVQITARRAAVLGLNTRF